MAVYPRAAMRAFPKPLALAFGLALAASAMAASGEQRGLMAWPDLLERPRPRPDATISYGDDPLQIVDVWVPRANGPHPVVLMVHGGCWQSEIADRSIMNWIAGDLRGRGIAVWNIDYRGVDRGGGNPTTFWDVGYAVDMLPEYAERHQLDISRIVAVGHSAGGHLALWAAGRPRLPMGSVLRSPNPQRIHAVVSLGGLPDLEEAATPPGSGCGTEIIARLTDGSFQDTSVPRLAPLGIPQVLINGLQDRIIPVHYAHNYAVKMRAAGDDVRVRMIEGIGHVELIAPESRAWAAAVEEIERALHPRHPGEEAP